MKNLKNKVLLRQLKKSKIDDFSKLDEDKFSKLLELIQETYDEMDDNVYRLERSLEISMKELNDLTHNLENKIEIELLKNREKDKQLIVQSKFASMGEMIANIAHQWRQPLSGISTVASSMIVQMQLDLTNPKEIEKSFEKILEFTNFLTQTIEDFRDYFKKDKYPKRFNIAECMNKTISIVETSYKNCGIEIYNPKKSEEFFSLGFPNEIKQVFLNILNNARDVLVSKEDISHKIVKIDYSENSSYTTISICDNGGGIPKSIIDNIFEPYFTTKHKSQGTGLGLYMCKQIIENHSCGKIDVQNVEFIVDDKKYYGASFNIYFKNKK